MITAEDIAAIPEGHRRTIARYLCDHALALRPSMFATQRDVEAISSMLLGVAVDIVEPVSEDTTVQRATEVLASLGVVAR